MMLGRTLSCTFQFDYQNNSIVKLYAISGLGADQRVFDKLELKVPVIPVDWIEPNQNESLEDYALRLSEAIDSSAEWGLIGLSFGGAIAIEIAKKLKPNVVFHVSSFQSYTDIPIWLRGVEKLGILSLIPRKSFIPPRKIAHYLFAAEDKVLLTNILDDTDPNFAKWATRALAQWKNRARVSNLISIHGTSDRMIPMNPKSTTHMVEGGGHFMIVDCAEDISGIINSELSQIEQAW